MRMITDMDDDEKGKLFVGGLSWETTQENLQRFFQRYGEVIDCVVMKNNESGRSRGFGFVTFSDPLNVNIVLQNGPHNLDGRTIDPKPCNPRTLQKPKKGGGYPKVFLGGLPSNVTETDLRVFFGRYGKVMEVVIMYDQEKKKSRGFGFLSFEDEASVERVTAEHYINLNGKQVEIKKAEPRGIEGGSGVGNAASLGQHNMNNNSNMNSMNMNSMNMNASKMNDNSQCNNWGPPQTAPLNMMQATGPNGQMSAPPINMAMGAPNMMGAPGAYQGGWTSPHQGYGYGSAPQFGGAQWGAAPVAPAQAPPPHQSSWNNAYAAPQQSGIQQSYGNYAPSGQVASGGTWNMQQNSSSWNMQQNSSGTAATGDMYQRAGQTSGSSTVMPPSSGPANTANKSVNDYTSNYGTNYGNYPNDQNSSYRPRSTYGNDNSNQYPPQPQGKPMLYDFN